MGAERFLADRLKHHGATDDRRKMLALAATVDDVINLGRGDPDLETPGYIMEAAKEGLDKHMTHYTAWAGLPELRRAVAKKFQADGIACDPNTDILITVGAQEAIFLTMQSILNPGDEVIVPEPRKDILLPKPHKIRISFNTVFSIIREFNSLYMKSWYDRGCRIVWDIYLTTVNDFKKEISLRDKVYFNSEMHKIDILTLNLPRYLWRVDGYMINGSDNNNLNSINFTLLFDATDIENSDIFICGIHYDLLSRIDIFLSVLNPLSELNAQKISKFSQSLRIAKEYSDLLAQKIIY